MRFLPKLQNLIRKLLQLTESKYSIHKSRCIPFYDYVQFVPTWSIFHSNIFGHPFMDLCLSQINLSMLGLQVEYKYVNVDKCCVHSRVPEASVQMDGAVMCLKHNPYVWGFSLLNFLSGFRVHNFCCYQMGKYYRTTV